jgi:hypothetical protein
MDDQPIQIQIAYDYGHARLGMGEAYSMRMLAIEFWALMQNDWSLYHKESSESLPNGTIGHETMTNGEEFHAGAVDIIAAPPARMQKPPNSLVKTRLQRSTLTLPTFCPVTPLTLRSPQFSA